MRNVSGASSVLTGSVGVGQGIVMFWGERTRFQDSVLA